MFIKLVQNVFINQKVKIFAIMPTKELNEHKDIIDDQVILARNIGITE